jgi:4-aminobutyrate aminotransferase-like enzyme
MGARLRERLLAIAERSRVVGDVRGRGLLMAIELVADKATRRPLPLGLVAPARVCALALEQGLALYARRTSGGAYGDWVMVTPPLIIDEAGVDELAEGLEAAVAVFERELHKDGMLE